MHRLGARLDLRMYLVVAVLKLATIVDIGSPYSENGGAKGYCIAARIHGAVGKPGIGIRCSDGASEPTEAGIIERVDSPIKRRFFQIG